MQPHLADLVEEDRAGAGGLELPRHCAACAPVNEPFSWPKSSLSSSSGGMAAQLMATKGRVRPAAFLVDEPGQHLLARAALPLEQERDLGIHDLAQRSHDLLHGGAFRHEPFPEDRFPCPGSDARAPPHSLSARATMSWLSNGFCR